MKEYEAVIGLEIHVELKTKSKMFSTGKNEYGAPPNTLVSCEDMGFPGTMPTVNKEGVRHAIKISNALNMTIDDELHFDRKNYFYPDLPKGYQITQNVRPIGSNGYIDIRTSQGIKRINIQRLHIEEDTCKQLHLMDCTLLDYNRAGVPLVEIVTDPDFRNGEEAMKYVDEIRSIVNYLDASDAKMEEGSLRCDVNISLREVGTTKFGTKVEIKNINSISNVQKAIDFEYTRQLTLINEGKSIQQETRRFDDGKKETILMRVKTDAVDYKYFEEPNITPIKLSKQFIEDTIASSNELASTKRDRYINEYGLTDYDSDVILADKSLALYFDELPLLTKERKLLANWLISDISAVLNKETISIDDFSISKNNIAELMNLIGEGKISNKQARDIFNKMLEKDESPKKLTSTLGLEQISDIEVIKKYVNDILDANAQSIEDYKAGKDRAIGFLVGQVMKVTQGKVNPGLTNKILLEELKKR